MHPIDDQGVDHGNDRRKPSQQGHLTHEEMYEQTRRILSDAPDIECTPDSLGCGGHSAYKRAILVDAILNQENGGPRGTVKEYPRPPRPVHRKVGVASLDAI